MVKDVLKGEDGYTPVKGVDYYTEEEKEEMKNEVVNSIHIPTNLSELNEDSTHKTVTETEKANWNEKSDFSGDYNDLTNKPDLSGFITKTVDDLVNYYKKSETYTQTEVNNLIGAIQQFHYEIVQTLPQTGSNNIMYLVPKSTNGTQNVYDEYVYANNNWEKIGDTEIDLSNYYTKTQVDALISNIDLSNYYTKLQVDALLSAKASQSSVDDLTALIGNLNDQLENALNGTGGE